MLDPKLTASATGTGNITPTGLTLAVRPSAGVAAQLAPFFKGDKGDPGSNGAGYDFTQSTPSDTWTVAHNLGFRPSVATYSAGGLEMLGTVQHLSADVLQISFSTPVAGTARLN